MNIFALLSGFSVPPTEGMHAQTLGVMNELLRRGHSVTCIAETRTDQKPIAESSISPAISFTRARGNYALRMISRSISPRFGKTILKYSKVCAEQADVIFVEGVALLPLLHYLKQHLNKPILFSPVDAWSLRQGRLVEGERWPASYMRASYSRLSLWLERSQLHAADGVHVYSPIDAEYLRRVNNRVHIVQIPTFFEDLDNLSEGHASDNDKPASNLTFWGDLGLPHIRAGYDLFLQHAWGKIKIAYPDIRLFVVGRLAEEEYYTSYRSDPRIIYMRWIPDLGAHMRSTSALICLDQSGTGLKNRVIEGMRFGLPVFVSAHAAEGIPLKEWDAAIFCEQSTDIADVFISLLGDSKALRKIGSNARLLFTRSYSRDVVASQWEAEFDRILASTRAAAC